MDLNEQEQFRRESLAKLRELGIEPYPAALYPINTSAAQIKAEYDEEKGNFQEVVIAGRIMSRRIMGAASFGELQDETGRIQIYVNRDEICPGEDKTMYNTVWKKLLDIGDIIGIKGFAFITKTGQLSVHAKELTLLSKSLRVLPIVKEKDGEVFDAFSDPERKYRQRYVDLIVNPQVRDTFIKRSQIVATMLDYCNEAGCLKWRPLSSRASQAELQHVRSSPTTTHSTFLSTSASLTSSTSRDSSSADTTEYMSSQRTSATRVWTRPTTLSSPAWRSMWLTRTISG